MPSVVVVGAGPVGLAAALGCLARGHAVTLVEAGRVGESLRRWGSRPRFFTPLSMNLPPSLVPPKMHDALLTGPEMAAVLETLAQTFVERGGRLRLQTRVVAIGRARLSRTDLPSHPLRAERPFRLLLETNGAEETLEVDRVLDAGGTYGQPQWAGAGGLPAVGERGRCIHRHLDALEHLVGPQNRTMVIGHGHSAATAIVELAESGAEICWVMRTANRRPIVETAADPLPERQRIAGRANDLASNPPIRLKVYRRAQVASFVDGIHLTNGTVIDERGYEILALTGYRPDLRPLELAIDIAADTEGAGRLARAMAGVTDCLSIPSLSPTDLDSGEPGFHLIGQKSYGRSRTFLLNTGLAQLDQILDRL